MAAEQTEDYTDLVELNNIHDKVSKLTEIVTGHRASLIAAGIGEDAADEMATTLHDYLAGELLT